MINREVTCTVKGRTTVLSEDIFLYKGDGSVQLLFNVVDYKYRFDPENMVQKAAIKTTNMTIVKPNKTSFKTNRTQCLDDQVVFNVARDLLDEQDEVGLYQIQIHLFDLENNRITIPPFNITILDTISDVPEPNLAILNASYADKAYLSNEKSNIKGPFEPGDLLTADNLNALHKFTLDTCEGTRDYIDQGLAQIKGEKEEVTNARGGLHYLKLRLERDKEEVLQIMREDLYKSFNGKRIDVNQSVKGITKNMKIEGRTLQNLLSLQKYEYICDPVDSNKYTKTESAGSVEVNITENLTSWSFISAGNINKNMFKPDTIYTIIGNFEGVENVSLMSNDSIYKFSNTISFNTNKAIIRINTKDVIDSIPSNIDIIIYGHINTSVGKKSVKNVMILEGDWTNKEVPEYFEGIQSVGEKENKISILSSGKNIVNMDKKEILLPDSTGLKSLPNGVCDTIENREDGVYFIQKIKKTIEDGRETYIYEESLSGTDVLFFYRILGDGPISDAKSNALCDKLTAYATTNRGTNKNRNIEGCYVGDGSSPLLQFHINKSKLSTPDVEGFKKWLQANPLEIYYELAEPTETKLYDYYSTNLQTYKDVTYIQSDNFILPEISCEIPVKEQIEG